MEDILCDERLADIINCVQYDNLMILNDPMILP